jgi:hypothetical protein
MPSLAKVISKLPKKKGVKAYHGSPHSFDAFDLSKIGTGEGVQAYGHGLYFAENEGVAKSYRDDLSSGTVLNVRPQTSAEEEVLSRIKNYSDEYGGVPEKATVYRDILNDYERAGEWVPAYEDMLNRAGGGSMYEVNIDADPNAFLDWDKALSEQPDVQARLATIGEASRSSTTKGVDKYISLENMLGAIDWPDNANAAVRAQYRKGAAARVSEKLKEAGIPGIKFLDAGSRGAGDGTRNYVVFDDKLISIVRKYGIAGASAMLGYNILDGMSNAQAAELQKQAYPTDSKNTNTKSLANFLKDRGAAATQGASTMFDGETGRDKNIPDQLADIGTQAVAGINRGVASLPGLPKDLAGLADWGLDAFGVSDNETLRNVINPGRMWPISGEDSIKAWESVAGDLPEAETDLGAVTDFLAQFATPGPGELSGAMSLSALMALPANKRLVTLVDEAKRLGVEPKVLANYYSGIKYNNPKIMSPNATAPEDWMKLVEDVPSQTPVKRRPEGLIGRTVYSAPGDMASTSIVHGINGRNVNPAQPGGGPRFTVKQKRIDEGAVWAGAPTAATGAINKSKAITDAGGDPLMINTTMASDATDYNAATADLVLQDIQAGKKTKAERKRLNDFLLEKFGPNGPDKTRIDSFDPKSFPGIDTDKNLEKTRALLLNNAPGPHGQMRTRMVKAFDGRDALDMGAPEIGPIRFAIADPDFALNDAQWAGGSLFKVDPNGKAIPSDHGTYAASYPGWGEGELDGRVPVGYLMPDWVKTNARQPLKPDGTLSSNDWYTFGRQGPTQKITEEMVDRWYKLGLFK